MNKQQNIVFFIGAGFSAPFGLPIMSNFISKAKDLYFSSPKSYPEILKALGLIEKYSSVKNYMHVNLFNIEDLLSIAYMESLIEKDQNPLRELSSFIKTVITHYTDNELYELDPFVKLISNIRIIEGSKNYRVSQYKYQQYIPDGKESKNTNFGLITLNYDLLIEKSIESYVSDYLRYYEVSKTPEPFKTLFSITKKHNSDGIKIAKLHGSIDSKIIPPTWNKNIEEKIHEDWELATHLLKNATHIIFLGYSLPITDNYIKFLFSSSLNSNKRLKKISSITLDSDGMTEKRFHSLFSVNFHFHNETMDKFLRFLEKLSNYQDYDFDSFDESFKEFR